MKHLTPLELAWCVPSASTTMRLVVRGSVVEHWLNGHRLTRYDLDSSEFRSQLQQSKFSTEPAFARIRRGAIGLQDHGDAVSFRNIRVRELAAAGGR